MIDVEEKDSIAVVRLNKAWGSPDVRDAIRRFLKDTFGTDRR